MGLYAVKSVKVTNVRGFSIELATSLVVIVAARFGEAHAAQRAQHAGTALPAVASKLKLEQSLHCCGRACACQPSRTLSSDHPPTPSPPLSLPPSPLLQVSLCPPPTSACLLRWPWAASRGGAA